LKNGIPKVSWILCAHLVNDALRLAIASCLNQTYTDFELIIVANGKHSVSVEIAIKNWFANEPKIRLFNTAMHNLNFSLSLGIHLARGELIARMDSDDISYPRRLALQVAFMECNPDVVVLGTAYELIDCYGNAICSASPPLSDLEIRRALPYRNPICHPTVIFRKSNILSIGGYMGSVYAQDYDLWIRLAAFTNIQFQNIPEICLGYRNNPSGLARNARGSYAAMAAAQIYIGLMSCKTKWFFGLLLSIIKTLSNRSRRD
jgi:glycosyltransferase involved in cell wall biosynthesis